MTKNDPSAYIRRGDKAKVPKQTIERAVATDACKHWYYSKDKVTGECTCDDCGRLLIDSIGRVLE